MLKLIKGTDNPLEYTHDELMESLKGNDEFTKYRIQKAIKKEEEKLLNQLKKPMFKKSIIDIKKRGGSKDD